MKWQKLSKEAFPKDIMKEENIKYTDINDRLLTRTIYYRSKKVYIIAVDINHEPESYCCAYRPMIDKTHFMHTCFADCRVTINTATGEVRSEEKEFYFEDGDGWMRIPVDDENIGYCRYKMVELEAITD